jgi:hypothetical protein
MTDSVNVEVNGKQSVRACRMGLLKQSTLPLSKQTQRLLNRGPSHRESFTYVDPPCLPLPGMGALNCDKGLHQSAAQTRTSIRTATCPVYCTSIKVHSCTSISSVLLVAADSEQKWASLHRIGRALLIPRDVLEQSAPYA